MFILASASPSRLRLLEAAGLTPQVIVSGVDEEAITRARPDAGPAQIAAVLAQAKAAAVADLPQAHGALVLACDSVFDVDGQPMGKPATADVARSRWQLMRDRSGILHTGHCLVDTAAGREAHEVVSTEVTMGDADDEEIDDYIASGEPLQVAGGFTLDGRGAPFIAGVIGDPGNVIGVSLPAVRRLARTLGYSWPDVLARSHDQRQ